MSGRIVAFYRNQASDHRGRFLTEIQQWPDEKLESYHDFIQWLFPLEDPSPVNPLAPTIDTETIQAFSTHSDLRAALRTSFQRMLEFYGFEIQNDPPVVSRANHFGKQAANWLHPGNHNHLRITRILKSLSLLGLAEEARAFFRALAEVYKEESLAPRPRITRETFRFWQSAVT